MKKLYKFKWIYNRGGDVEGIFVEDDDKVASAMGIKVYFGEIRGKHSESYGTLGKEDLTVLTEDQDFIKKAEEYGIVPSGYSPFDYIEEEDLKEYILEKRANKGT